MNSYLPRFALRDLFWLVLVFALVIGWFLDHSLQTSQQKWAMEGFNARYQGVQADKRYAESMEQVAQLKKQLADKELKSMESDLRLRLTELAKLHFAIRKLDKVTQDNLYETVRTAPEPGQFDIRKGDNVRNLIPD